LASAAVETHSTQPKTGEKSGKSTTRPPPQQTKGPAKSSKILSPKRHRPTSDAKPQVFIILYQEVKGISLKKKVNFKRRMCSDEDHIPPNLKGQNIIEIVEADYLGNVTKEEFISDARLECQFCSRLFEPSSFPKH